VPGLLREFGLYLAWLVAVVATLGSLYFSEVRLFVPCALCWYQRILMYPLVVVLGIASFKQDTQVVRYALPLASLGALFALYHYAQQKIPGFAGPTLCRVGVPCTVEYINWLGFITIPFLALVAFVLIIALLLGVRQAARREAAP
jgi:disulfide bond formation protein DsbB